MVRHAIVAFTVTCRGYRERVLAGALRGPQARRRRLSAAIPRPPFATAQFCPNVVVTYRPVPIRSGLVAALLVLAAPLQVRADGPSRAEQRCIVALNRAGTKMAVASAHAFVGCAKRIALGRTPAGQTLTACAASVAGASV